jgi:hypothetical protein
LRVLLTLEAPEGIADILEVESHATLLQACSLAAPVTQQMSLRTHAYVVVARQLGVLPYRSGSKPGSRRHTDRSPSKQQVWQLCLALPVSWLPVQAYWLSFQLIDGTIDPTSLDALRQFADIMLQPWAFRPVRMPQLGAAPIYPGVTPCSAARCAGNVQLPFGIWQRPSLAAASSNCMETMPFDSSATSIVRRRMGITR